MQYLVRQFIERFERLPRMGTGGFLFAFSALVGFIDYLTGYEISVTPLYVLTVILAAWIFGLYMGLFFALMNSTILIAAALLAGQTYTETWVIVWNIFVPSMAYAMVAYLAVGLRELLAEAQHQSFTDALTGAWNRRAFYQDLAQEIARAKRGHHFSLVYIDVDDFKLINDSRGHEAGDKVLQDIVSICQSILRQTDRVARLGGDEFALLLSDTDAATVQGVMHRLQERLGTIRLGTQLISLSVGAVTCVQPPPTIDAIIHYSDDLMYEVKRAGKGAVRYAVYPDT